MPRGQQLCSKCAPRRDDSASSQAQKQWSQQTSETMNWNKHSISTSWFMAVCVLERWPAQYPRECTLSHRYQQHSPAIPFGIIKKNKHASAFIILKAFIVMAVSIANQVIKDSGVNDVQEAWAWVIGGRFLHSIAVALIVFPPGGKRHHKGYWVPATPDYRV